LRASLWGTSAKISESDMKEAMLTASPKAEDVLGRDISQGIDINEIIRDVSVHYIERALTESSGRKTKAAELLSLKNYQTLNNWMEKYKVS
jgi:transcriptional regulator with PAS, ATPase and Fis domain